MSYYAPRALATNHELLGRTGVALSRLLAIFRPFPVNSDVLSQRKQMGPKIIELCEKLREASTLLKSAGENHWAAWLDKSLSRIERRDLSGVDHLLGAYGGMGSFNDLILMSANGHSVTDDNYREVNDRLDALRSQLYELARDVRRNAVTEE